MSGFDLVSSLAEELCERALLAGAVAAKSRAAFFQCFIVFAVAADKLAEALTAPQAVAEPEADRPPASAAIAPAASTDARLLTLFSNCQHVRNVVLPSLCERYDCFATSEAIYAWKNAPSPNDISTIWHSALHSLFCHLLGFWRAEQSI